METGEELLGNNSVFDQGFLGVQVLPEGGRDHRVRVQLHVVLLQEQVPAFPGPVQLLDPNSELSKGGIIQKQ